MTTFPTLSDIKRAWGSVAILPETKQRKEAENRVANEITSLVTACNEKTGAVFQNKVTEIKLAIRDEKQLCLQDLLLMNGHYYQDPRSALKTAWDGLVKSVDQANGFKIERADQLDDVLAQLRTDQTPQKNGARQKIVHYKKLEAIRNNRQTQLNRILATEKAAENPDDLLKQQKELLKHTYHELCGDYFGDPKGLLDQAWQKYQTGLAHGSTDESSLDVYQGLEESRKTIEAKLYEIEQQFSAPISAHRTFDQLTIDTIIEQVKEFKALLKAKDIAKVSLSKIAAKATQTALINAGYIYIPLVRDS
jgi:hypothetical protein